MDYKKNVRSPNYGKIFAYDAQGREVKELDMLKIRVTHDGVDYTVGQLLEFVIAQGKMIQEAKEQKLVQDERILKLENSMDKVDIMSKLVVLLDVKIKSLELK